MKILLVVLLLAVIVNGILTEQPSNMSEPVQFICIKANSTTYYEVPLNDPNVTQKLDFSKKTHIFFHGWRSNITEPWADNYRTNWFDSGRSENANLCFGNWSKLAYDDYVTTAVKNQRDVASYTAQVYLPWLHAQGLSYSDLILIGHSLGAHIAGLIGNYLLNLILCIIGLDPAGPLFEGLPDLYRLSAGDALYVQVIHTGAPVYGYTGRIGDADFYVNFGIILQPQCPLITFLDLITIRCSHFRALDLFIDSLVYLTQKLCRGVRCPNVASYLARNCPPETVSLFGLDADQTLTGEFYASTKNSATCTGDLYIDYIPITRF